MFGGSVGAAAQGSTVVERNLDRITVMVALISPSPPSPWIFGCSDRTGHRPRWWRGMALVCTGGLAVLVAACGSIGAASTTTSAPSATSPHRGGP